MDNGLVDVNAASEAIPETVQKHIINCMRLSCAMLGESANTEPGQDMDQVALILSQLPAVDVGKLLAIFEVPMTEKERLADPAE